MVHIKPSSIPKLQYMLLNIEGFMHVLSLDLNLGWYQIEVSPVEKQHCAILFPWVKYEYQKLLIVFYNSPDIF